LKVSDLLTRHAVPLDRTSGLSMKKEGAGPIPEPKPSGEGKAANDRHD
jgi:hypothetical protein